MPCRVLCSSLVSVSLLLASSGASAAEPLAPVKPWVVNYDTAECTAQRAYGDPADPLLLVLGPSAWGNSYELMIVKSGSAPKFAEQLEGSVNFGQGPIKAWLLRWGTDKPKLRQFIKFRISEGDIAQAKNASAVTFHMERRPDVSLSLSAVPDLLSTLQNCTVDLQHYWNMIDPEQKKIAAPAIGDVRKVFTSNDYPSEALTQNQEGQARFLLFVDEQGKIPACYVVEPSGIPALDGMGCQVIRQRAKFKPAIDTAGKPIRSIVITPPVIWRLYG